MYDSLVVLNSKMMALKKGMKYENVGVKDFVSFTIENLRTKTNSIPRAVRNIVGKIFLSKIVRVFLKKVAKNASENGWPTEVFSGTNLINSQM